MTTRNATQRRRWREGTGSYSQVSLVTISYPEAFISATLRSKASLAYWHIGPLLHFSPNAQEGILSYTEQAVFVPIRLRARTQEIYRALQIVPAQTTSQFSDRNPQLF